MYLMYEGTLDKLKGSDFGRYRPTARATFKNVEFIIERDRLNDKWIFYSTSHPISGDFVGGIVELKEHIKELAYKRLKED